MIDDEGPPDFPPHATSAIAAHSEMLSVMRVATVARAIYKVSAPVRMVIKKSSSRRAMDTRQRHDRRIIVIDIIDPLRVA